MTGPELSRQLKRLGMNNRELAEALDLGKGGERTVRRWLSGERTIRGPVKVAINAVLKQRGLEGRAKR
jgi:hypothetical protein